MKAGLTAQPRFRLVLEAGACEHSVEWAHAAVDEAARLGAWGFKVQMYQAPTLVHRTAPHYGEPELHEPKLQWDSFADALPYDAWLEVKDHCDEQGIVFFASVFDEHAVQACEDMDVQAYKVASADITHRPLLETVRRTGKPIILSTGASYLWEVERALDWLTGADVTLLACNLRYPTPLEEAHLTRMDTLRTLTHNVGYSDHTRGLATILTAKAYGAVMIEKHFTITPELNAGDHAFAITPDELEGWEEMDWSLADGGVLLGSSLMEPNSGELLARERARRGVYARRVILAGSGVLWEDLAFVRPSALLEPWQAYGLVGRTAMRDYLPGDPIGADEL